MLWLIRAGIYGRREISVNYVGHEHEFEIQTFQPHATSKGCAPTAVEATAYIQRLITGKWNLIVSCITQLQLIIEFPFQ